MPNVSRLAKLAFIATACTVLICCNGFKLRGSYSIPSYLKTVYITPIEPYEPFQRELRARLTRQDVKIVTYPADGVTILEISAPKFDEQILAYSTSGQVQRSKLTYSVTYKLITKDGTEISESNNVVRTRELSKSNNQLLTNEREENIVRRELLNETVLELLRQITTRPLHNAPMPDSSTTDDNPC